MEKESDPDRECETISRRTTNPPSPSLPLPPPRIRQCWTWKWDPNAPWDVTSGSSYWVSLGEETDKQTLEYPLCQSLSISSHHYIIPILICLLRNLTPTCCGALTKQQTNKIHSLSVVSRRQRRGATIARQSKLSSNARSQTGWGRPSMFVERNEFNAMSV